MSAPHSRAASSKADLAFESLVSFGTKPAALSLEEQRRQKLQAASAQPMQSMLSSPAPFVQHNNSQFNSSALSQPSGKSSVLMNQHVSVYSNNNPQFFTSSLAQQQQSQQPQQLFSNPKSYTPPLQPLTANLSPPLNPNKSPSLSTVQPGFQSKVQPLLQPGLQTVTTLPPSNLNTQLFSQQVFEPLIPLNATVGSAQPSAIANTQINHWDFDLLTTNSVTANTSTTKVQNNMVPDDIFDVGFLDSAIKKSPSTATSNLALVMPPKRETLNESELESEIEPPIINDFNDLKVAETLKSPDSLVYQKNDKTSLKKSRLDSDPRLDWHDDDEAPFKYMDRDFTYREESIESSRYHGYNVSGSRYVDKKPENEQPKRVINIEQLQSNASAIGATVFSNAISVFEFSKKKIGQVVELAKEQYDLTIQQQQQQQQNSRRGDRWHDDEGINNRSPRYRDSHDERVPPPRPPRPPRPAQTKEAKREQGLSEIYSPIVSKSSSSTSHSSIPLQAWSDPVPPIQAEFEQIPIEDPDISSEILQQSELIRQAGNQLFKLGQYAQADESYTQSLNLFTFSSGDALHLEVITLLNNRASARLKIGDYNGVVTDCTMILSRANQSGRKDDDDLNTKALIRRAGAFEGLEKWKEAEGDYRMVLRMCGSSPIIEQGLKRCIGATEKVSGAVKVKVDSQVVVVSKPVDVAVRNAVDGAVRRLREQNVQAEKEDELKLALKDDVDARVLGWRGGKEANLRALLSSLDSILWKELNWKSINLSELITPQQVKIRYMKAVAKVHPDKLGQDITIEQKLIANAVFSTLNNAWDAFKVQNNLQ